MAEKYEFFLCFSQEKNTCIRSTAFWTISVYLNICSKNECHFVLWYSVGDRIKKNNGKFELHVFKLFGLYTRTPRTSFFANLKIYNKKMTISWTNGMLVLMLCAAANHLTMNTLLRMLSGSAYESPNIVSLLFLSYL